MPPIPVPVIMLLLEGLVLLSLGIRETVAGSLVGALLAWSLALLALLNAGALQRRRE